MLDRDELAARFAVADLSNPNFATDFTDAKEVARWAAGLKGLADALLAALVPVEPASGAPATEPRRTVGAVVTWASGKVKFIVVETGNGERVQRELDLPNEPCVYSDPTDAFVRWATREECERHGLNYVARPLPGAPLAAPSPAATPAAWVPSVGDVVQDKDHPEFAQLLVTRVDAPAFYAKVITRTGAPTDKVMRYADRYRFVRRATSSERAAAGLPVEESEVDRVALAKAMRDEWIKGEPIPSAGSWSDMDEDMRGAWLRAADAAIAFLKANGGVA